MATLSNNDIRLRVSTSSDNKGLDDASDRLEHLSGSAGRANIGMDALGKTATVALSGIGILTAGIGALSTMSIKATGDFEANRVAFDVMLGSADKASQLMTQIAQFAKTTPFELPDVVSGAKKLLAYGFAQDEIIGTMSHLGDVAAGVGVNFGELVDIYGKARTQGTLFTEDFDQFTGRGIPLAKALSSELGVAPEKVRALASEGKITFPVLQKGFENMTGAGSQFGGMMDKQSQTFNGIMSNLSDGFQGILRHAAGMDDAGNIIKGGFFDRVKGSAADLMPVLSNIGDGIGGVIGWVLDLTDKIGAWLAPVFQEATKFAQAFGEELNGGDVKSGGDMFIDIAKDLADNLKILGDKFKDLWSAVSDKDKDFIADLAKLLGGVLYAAIIVVMAAIAAIVDTIKFFLDTGQNLKDFWDDVKTNWSKGTGDIKKNVTDFFNGIGGFFRDAGTNIKNGANQIVEGVKKFVTDAVTNITNFFTHLPENIGMAIGFIVQSIINFVTIDLPNFINSVIDWFNHLPENIGKALSDMWTSITTWFSKSGDDMGKFVSDAVTNVINWFKALPKNIGDAVTTLWNNVVAGFNSFKDSAIQWAKDTVDAIVKYFRDLPGKISGSISDAWNGAVGGVNDFINGVNKGSKAAKRASGGPVAAGRPYIVGDNPDGSINSTSELFVPSQSGSIMSSKDLQRSLGSSTTVTIGNIYLGDSGAVDRFFSRIDQDNSLAKKGLTPNRGMA